MNIEYVEETRRTLFRGAMSRDVNVEDRNNRVFEEMKNASIEIDPDSVEIVYKEPDEYGVVLYEVVPKTKKYVPYKVTREELYRSSLTLDDSTLTDEQKRQKALDMAREAGINVEDESQLEITFREPEDNSIDFVITKAKREKIDVKYEARREIYSGIIDISGAWHAQSDEERKNEIIEMMRKNGIEVSDPNKVEIGYEGAEQIGDGQTTEFRVFERGPFPYYEETETILEGEVEVLADSNSDILNERIREAIENAHSEIALRENDQIEFTKVVFDNDKARVSFRIKRQTRKYLDQDKVKEEDSQTIKAEIMSLYEEIIRLRREIEEARGRKKTQLMVQLQDLVQQISEKLEIHRKSSIEMEIEEDNTEITRKAEEIERLKADLKDKRTRLEELRTSLDELKESMASENAEEIEQIQIEIDKLLSEINVLKTGIDTKQKYIRRKKKKITDLNRDLEMIALLGITEEDYKKIKSVIKNDSVFQTILEKAGIDNIDEILEIKRKTTRTAEEEERLAAVVRQIELAIAEEMKKGGSVLEAVQKLYGIDPKVKKAKEPRAVVQTTEENDALRSNASEMTSRVRRDEADVQQEEPGKAPAEMQTYADGALTVVNPRNDEITENQAETALVPVEGRQRIEPPEFDINDIRRRVDEEPESIQDQLLRLLNASQEDNSLVPVGRQLVPAGRQNNEQGNDGVLQADEVTILPPDNKETEEESLHRRAPEIIEATFSDDVDGEDTLARETPAEEEETIVGAAGGLPEEEITDDTSARREAADDDLELDGLPIERNNESEVHVEDERTEDTHDRVVEPEVHVEDEEIEDTHDRVVEPEVHVEDEGTEDTHDRVVDPEVHVEDEETEDTHDRVVDPEVHVEDEGTEDTHDRDDDLELDGLPRTTGEGRTPVTPLDDGEETPADGSDDGADSRERDESRGPVVPPVTPPDDGEETPADGSDDGADSRERDESRGPVVPPVTPPDDGEGTPADGSDDGADSRERDESRGPVVPPVVPPEEEPRVRADATDEHHEDRDPDDDRDVLFDVIDRPPRGSDEIITIYRDLDSETYYIEDTQLGRFGITGGRRETIAGRPHSSILDDDVNNIIALSFTSPSPFRVRILDIHLRLRREATTEDELDDDLELDGLARRRDEPTPRDDREPRRRPEDDRLPSTTGRHDGGPEDDRLPSTTGRHDDEPEDDRLPSTTGRREDGPEDDDDIELDGEPTRRRDRDDRSPSERDPRSGTDGRTPHDDRDPRRDSRPSITIVDPRRPRPEDRGDDDYEFDGRRRRRPGDDHTPPVVPITDRTDGPRPEPRTGEAERREGGEAHHLQRILYNITEGLQIDRNSGARWVRANQNVSRRFLDELSRDEYLYNIVHLVPAVISYPIGLMSKLSARLMTSPRARRTSEQIVERLNNLSDADMEVLYQEYRGSQLRQDMNNQINPYIIDAVKRYAMRKIQERIEVIRTNYIQLIQTKNQIETLRGRLATAPLDEREEINNQIARLYAQGSEFVKTIIRTREEVNKELSGGVHGLEEDMKAIASKVNYVGLRFAKSHDFPNEVQSQLADAEDKMYRGIEGNNPEEAVEGFMERDAIYLGNTAITGSIFGRRSSGKKYYSPLPEELDYRDDPFIRDLLTTIAVTTTIANAANTARVRKLEQQRVANNPDLKPYEEQVRQAGDRIVSHEGDVMEGMHAQAEQDVLSATGASERASLDKTDWHLNDDYHVLDRHSHADYNRFNNWVQRDANSIISDLSSGAITQQTAVERMAELAAQAEAQRVAMIREANGILQQYASTHGQFDLTAWNDTYSHLLNNPSALANYNSAATDMLDVGRQLQTFTLPNNVIQHIPIPIASAIIGATSASILASNISNGLRRSTGYGNEVTRMMNEYVTNHGESTTPSRTTSV